MPHPTCAGTGRELVAHVWPMRGHRRNWCAFHCVLPGLGCPTAGAAHAGEAAATVTRIKPNAAARCTARPHIDVPSRRDPAKSSISRPPLQLAGVPRIRVGELHDKSSQVEVRAVNEMGGCFQVHATFGCAM